MTEPASESLNVRILHERIRLVANRSFVASLSTPVAASLLLVISRLENLQQASAFLWWFGLLLFAVLHSLSLTWPIWRHGRTPPEGMRWLRHYCFSKWLLGTCWGIVVWFLLPEASIAMTLMVYLVLCGVAAVVVIVQSMFWSAAMSFLCGILLPIIIHAQQPEHTVLDSYVAISGTVYLILLGIYSLTINRQLIRDIRAIVEANQLSSELMDANIRTEQALAALQDEHRRLQYALSTITQMARHDELTQLLNRRAILALLQQFMMEDGPLCLVMFDIDHFKRINDEHGHDMGDQVLQGMAKRISSTLHSGEYLARLGGEEFLLVFSMNAKDALRRCESIRTLLISTPLVETPPLMITASFGLADRHPSESLSEWLKRADLAMYAAKHAGRNRIHAWHNQTSED